MEPDGIVKACTANWRMTRASSTAMMIASAYSRTSDLRRGAGATGRRRARCRVGTVSEIVHAAAQLLSTDRNASCGTSTLPTCFIRFLPSFCFSSSLRLRVMSPP